MSEQFTNFTGGGGGGNLGELIISIVADAGQFVKDAIAAKNQVKQGFEGLKDTFDEAFKGASDAVKLFGRILRDDMQQNRVSLQEAFNSLRSGVRGFTTGSKAELEDMQDAFRRLGGTVKTTQFQFKDFLRAAGRLVGIVSVLAVLRRAFQALMRTIRDSIDEYASYTFELFRLEVAVRAAQRRMGEAAGLTEEWTGFVQELREQFKIFSTRDLTAATAKVILLTRELGFTREQMESVTRAAVVLAEVNGIQVAEAARRLAFFLDTGISRGLQTMGVQVNRATVEMFALREGIDLTWNEMSRAERASLSLAAVLEQTAALTDDAGRAAETFKGQLMELRAASDDAMIAIGDQAGFLQIMWATVKLFFLTDLLPGIANGLKNLVAVVIQAVAAMTTVWLAFFEVLPRAVDKFIKGEFTDFQDFIDTFANATATIFTDLVDQLMGQYLPGIKRLGDVTEEEMSSMSRSLEGAAEDSEEFQDAVTKAIEAVTKEFERFGQAVDDLNRRLTETFEDLNRKFAFDLIDMARTFGFKLQDIIRKFSQRREDAILKSRRREQEINERANEDIIQAQARFRFEEIRDQRRFNLEMARLQREFLFALEDAVRERDARQVLMLMRRNNLDRLTAQENFDDRRAQAEAQLELEVKRIRRAAAIRRAEERRNLIQRLADLGRQQKIEMAAARRNFLRRQEQMMLEHQRRREQERIEFDRRMEQLNEFHRRRLETIGQALAKEVGANIEAARAVLRVWVQTWSSLITLQNTFMRGFNMQAFGQPKVSPFGAGQTQSRFSSDAVMPSDIKFLRGGFQHGGSVVASKPTAALFGEGGPELGSFIPLNKLGQMGAGMGGRIGLDITIRAEDGFVADVSEQVMSDVADVVINTEREAR